MSRRLSVPPYRFAALAAAGAALCAAVLVAAPPVVAQDEPAEVFIDRVEVDVVNLEVVVTDDDGNPIRGLTKEDFRVFEDGEPVDLTNFYAVEGGARRDLAEEPADSPLLDLGEEEAAAEEVLPEEQRLSLAVVIDNANIDPGSRKRILDQLREHLEAVLRPGDRVMVASLEPQLEVRQGFTDDVAAVDAALDEIGRAAAGRADLFAQRRMIRQSISTLDNSVSAANGPESRDTPEAGADRVLQLITSYAAQAETVMRQTFTSLDTLTASLAGLPGRRAVLLVSEHLSTNPVQTLLEEWYNNFSGMVPGLRDPINEGRRFDVSESLRRVAHQAAADRVTFYTLHASGSRMPGAGDGMMLAAPGATADLGSMEPLMHLAAATGGSSMLNSGNAEALVERMSADYRDYYSLGYTSPKSQDGRYHRIEVRVPGRDLRVRHTEGYRAKTAEQRMKERTLSALIFDVADNPLDVRVQLLPEQEQNRHYVLPVMVRVPISRLVLLPQESVHVAKLTIVVAVRDADGGLSNPQRVEVPIEIPNDKLLEAMGQDVGHGLNLLVRKGDSKLAVGVRDELSAVESTLNLNVSVGEG